MRDQPVTASAIIGFSQDLENRSARFYRTLGETFAEHRETFQAFAKGCAKHRTQITRTYQETITDALEAGFSFEGIRLADWAADSTVAEGISLADALEMAVALEEKAIAFYEVVAERSQSLLATIPQAFKRVAKKRRRRREDLKAIMGTLTKRG